MEPLNEISQIAQEYGLLPADARQQKLSMDKNERNRFFLTVALKESRSRLFLAKLLFHLC